MKNATQLLVDCSGDFLATTHIIKNDELLLNFDLQLSDGSLIPYEILARIGDNAVTAQEYMPKQLPAYCPERHINSNGTFCMYWAGDNDLNVVDEQSAIVWWETLFQFLKLQVRAQKREEWPNNNYWAHGEAAFFQKMAYEAASNLGENFLELLKKKLLKAEFFKRNAGNGNFLRVYLQDKHYYTVWLDHKKTACLKQVCICSKKGNVCFKRCGDHAQFAFDLAVNLYEWDRAEKKFWDGYKHKECCGTIKECPLRKDGKLKSNPCK